MERICLDEAPIELLLLMEQGRGDSHRFEMFPGEFRKENPHTIIRLNESGSAEHAGVQNEADILSPDPLLSSSSPPV